MQGWSTHAERPHGPGRRGPFDARAGMGGFGGPGGRRRMRRGAIRLAVLWALADGPGHGYEVMRRMEERSGGAWRPSPGSVYPTLQMLEDEGLVRSREEDGTRVYELTDTGRAEGATPSWGPPGTDPAQLRALHEAVVDTRAAVRQIVTAGRPHQVEKATDVLQEARRSLYQLLAEG